jgi:hypothetical protein
MNGHDADALRVQTSRIGFSRPTRGDHRRKRPMTEERTLRSRYLILSVGFKSTKIACAVWVYGGMHELIKAAL